METLTIKSPADVLSFIGHTLGFWPKESLVCITLDNNRVGATLRIDLPKHTSERLPYARTVAGYLSNDAKATSVLFAVYTSTPWHPGQEKPHTATIAALADVLAYHRITIKDGILVGDHTFAQYTLTTNNVPVIPITATQTSQINAEFIYRGSTIAPTDKITLPAPTQQAAKATAVHQHMEHIRQRPTSEAINEARDLWSRMLNSKDFPTDNDIAALIANFQFAAIRDRLITDIPAIDEPMGNILFAQTQTKPQWSRIEWAQQLLLHAYNRTSTEHSAPILTAIGYINWWEGRGSKAHRYLQLALETDPTYRLAALSDQMVGSGIVAGWNTNKDTAYKSRGLETP